MWLENKFSKNMTLYLLPCHFKNKSSYCCSRIKQIKQIIAMFFCGFKDNDSSQLFETGVAR